VAMQFFSKTINFRVPKETVIGSVMSENAPHYLPLADMTAFWSLILKDISNNLSFDSFLWQHCPMYYEYT
jgi:hypothetical protein